MFRYRCPHCAALTAAHERRAGQASVCRVCVTPHAIPADRSLWLSESGEQLDPPAPAAPAGAGSAPEPHDAQDAHRPMASHDQLPPTVPEFALPPHGQALPQWLAPLSVPDAAPGAEPPGEPERAEPVRVEVVPADPVPLPIPPARAVAVARPEPIPSARAAATAQAQAVLTPLPVAVLSPVADDGPPPARPVHPPPRAPRAPRSDRTEPVQLQTQADIAAALTAVLTSRMKPPASPRRDLRPSTAVWMLLTGLGVALAGVALFGGSGRLEPALAVGVVEIAIGYGWIVRLTHQRNPRRGILCAVPPLTLVYLFQYKYARLRPLRFVATGAALVLLAALTPRLAPYTRELVYRDEPEVPPPVDPATQSKLTQLRTYGAHPHRSYEALCQLLEVLAKTDPLLSEDRKDRAELVTELKALCRHADTGVKVRAMSAYARWDPEGAREVCLAAVRSESSEERKRALELLPQWRDNDSARAVQSLIGRPGTVETNEAKAALEKIGGPPAEQAAWVLLYRAAEHDQATKLTAVSVLERVGAAKTAEDLRGYARAADETAVRNRALSAANAIEARVRATDPKP